MIFIDPTRKTEYVLKAQREIPAEQQVRFVLKVISARRWSQMVGEETAVSVSEKRPATGADLNMFLLRYCCDGWTAAEGQPKAGFDAEGRLTWESIDVIPLQYRNELADEAFRMNTLMESDLPN